MKLEYSIATPRCGGINHADFAIDGSFALFTCEFDGAVTKIDLVNRTGARHADPEPVLRSGPTWWPSSRRSRRRSRSSSRHAGAGAGRARARRRDLHHRAACRRTSASRPTARPSSSPTCWPTACMWSTARRSSRSASSRPASARTASIPAATARSLYVANRGTNKMIGAARRGKGSVSVIDFATRKVVKTWPIPGGGSPDMGNVSADGKYLWLSGRFDDVVYRIETDVGRRRQGQGRPRAARPHRLAAARPLFAGPHRQSALR